ncbi:MAG: hypothetical protein IJ925_08060 [Muribaculaceae bacterium]|nr:hypothetical protein [Muribaculaceae bacterium]
MNYLDNNMVEGNNIISNIVVMFSDLNDDIKKIMLNIVTYFSAPPALQVA